jgi:hypothetical protein
MSIYIVPNTGVPVAQKVSEYFQMTYTNFIDLLFNDKYKIVESPTKSKIHIYGIQTTSNNSIDSNKKNILLCVENCSVGRTHYKHFNEFQHFNDRRINVFIYNDISKIVKTDKYIAIPFVYAYIDQFIRIQNQLTINTPFDKKKFCLFTSRNMLNENKQKILQGLSKIGQIDSIEQYNLSKYSCYHSDELLRLFNQYKFIICFENSNTNGYITEKIFNVFLSKSIPIYDGAPNISDYINTSSYINFNDSNFVKKINLLSTNEKLYNIYINSNKISDKYDNEDWFNHMITYLE